MLPSVGHQHSPHGARRATFSPSASRTRHSSSSSSSSTLLAAGGPSQTSPIITYQRRNDRPDGRTDDRLASAPPPPPPPRNYLFIHSRHQSDQRDGCDGPRCRDPTHARDAYRTADVMSIAAEKRVSAHPADRAPRSTENEPTNERTHRSADVVVVEIICLMAARLTERNGHGG